MLEEQFRSGHDFSFLIGPACMLVEAELCELLVTPAQPVAATLIDCLKASQNDRQADILADWACGKKPPMIGHSSIVAMALRRGLEQENPILSQFLNEHFKTSFHKLLRTNSFARSIDRLRETRIAIRPATAPSHSMPPITKLWHVWRSQTVAWCTGEMRVRWSPNSSGRVVYCITCCRRVCSRPKPPRRKSDRAWAIDWQRWHLRGSKLGIRVEMRHEPGAENYTRYCAQFSAARVGLSHRRQRKCCVSSQCSHVR